MVVLPTRGREGGKEGRRGEVLLLLLLRNIDRRRREGGEERGREGGKEGGTCLFLEAP